MIETFSRKDGKLDNKIEQYVKEDEISAFVIETFSCKDGKLDNKIEQYVKEDEISAFAEIYSI